MIWIRFGQDDVDVWHRWVNYGDNGPDPIMTWCGLTEWTYDEDNIEDGLRPPWDDLCLICRQSVQ